MENIDLKALFNSPEPDTIEQQKSAAVCIPLWYTAVRTIQTAGEETIHTRRVARAV